MTVCERSSIPLWMVVIAAMSLVAGWSALPWLVERLGGFSGG